MTNISWTTETWNPIVGCSIDTKGCTNCYAMRQAWRFSHNPSTPQYHGTAKLVNGNPVWTGKMNLAQKAMLKPLHHKKPTTYFVNSMGDLFHENVPDEWIDQVFAVMAMRPQHTFQILTKRAERMRKYMTSLKSPSRKFDILLAGRRTGVTLRETKDIDDAISTLPLPNVWLGVSCEDQTTADLRIPALLQTPAAIRFVSCEPLLGPVDFHFIDGTISALHGIEQVARENGYIPGKYELTEQLDWVICGGESGPNARPMHPDWARSLRDQCVDAGVPFHFKQWGEFAPWDGDNWEIPDGWDDVACRDNVFLRHGVEYLKVGPKTAGRLLDGREWLQMPEVRT